MYLCGFVALSVWVCVIGANKVIPCSRLKTLKTIPSSAAQTRLGQIRGFPSPRDLHYYRSQSNNLSSQ